MTNKQTSAREKRDIEKLLSWAYLEEISKRHTSAAEGIWDRLSQYGSLGGIDPDPGHGSAQRYAQFGLPHPDAEAIEKAVSALGSVSIEDHFDVIVGELAALVSINDLRPRKAARVQGRVTEAGYYDPNHMPPAFAPRDVILVRSVNVAALVVTHAVMGTRPDWTSEQPRPKAVSATRGRGFAVVGECRGKDLYTAGSYCPLAWEPSPIEIIQARADYAVWHDALTRLAATLELEDFEPLPPAASAAPWHDEQKTERVWSYAVAPATPLPLKPQRKRAGPPPTKHRRRPARPITSK